MARRLALAVEVLVLEDRKDRRCSQAWDLGLEEELVVASLELV